MLNDKQTLIDNRENNRRELRRLRLLLQSAKGRERIIIQDSIGVGVRMIDNQTRRIKELSMHKIADKLGTSTNQITYYEKSATISQTERQNRIVAECKKRNTPEYKSNLKAPL